jgi:hypothetical protein
MVIPDRIDQPLRWRKPRRVLVCPQSDLFHEQVPDGYIAMIWITMSKSWLHQFHIRTKQPDRMRAWVARWNDLAGESFDFLGANGPQAVREAHPSGRGQLFAAYLDELVKAFGVNGKPPHEHAWPTFDWMEGPRWWPTIVPWNIEMSEAALPNRLGRI